MISVRFSLLCEGLFTKASGSAAFRWFDAILSQFISLIDLILLVLYI